MATAANTVLGGAEVSGLASPGGVGGLTGGADDLSQSMAGKYCIVTGSNSGIGLQVARGLMRRGAHVVMACRNMVACEQAASSLRGEGLPGSCACRRIDLEDLDSIRSFVHQQAAELREGQGGPLVEGPRGETAETSGGSGPAGRPQQSPQRSPQPGQQEGDADIAGDGSPCSGGGAAAAGFGPRGAGGRGGGGRGHVDVVVNNAGVMGVSRAPDGSDRHLAANHLGPYLLTCLLLPHMTHGSRVVNVASRAHYGGALSLVTDPPGREGFRDDVHHWWWQYARSKLCNVLFTAELQRRYGWGPAGLGTPGSGGGGGCSGGGFHGADSGGGGRSNGAAEAHGPEARRPAIGAYAVSPGLVDSGIFRHLVPSVAPWLAVPLRAFCRTPEQGAQVVLYAACSRELEGRDALFLHDCREMRPSAAARDPQLAADLWRVSAALVGLHPDDDGAVPRADEAAALSTGEGRQE